MTRRLSLLVLVLAALGVPAVRAGARARRQASVRNGNFSPIIGDLDRSLAFYEGLLTMQVPPARDGQRPFFNNPGLHRMFGTTRRQRTAHRCADSRHLDGQSR